MKKLFLIAVAGMMMFAFTQCGPYRSAKRILNSAISDVKNAKDCKELEQISNEFGKEWEEWERKYSDYKPTDEEEEKLGELYGELFGELLDKSIKLGCGF